MAKRFVAFNLWAPASEDWNYMSEAYDQTARLRWTDTHTWGILRNNAYPAVVDIPVSAVNAAPPRWPNILSAPVSLDCATGLVSVGAGSTSSADPKVAGMVAYDLYGDRVAILDDAPFDFSNASPYGFKSSGNLNIALNLAGTSGDCFTNPSIPGTYYLWVEYLEVNDPTPVLSELGVVFYPVVDDGYRIRVTDTPDAPSGDGVSIFLDKVTWIGGSGVLTATDANVSDSNGNAVEPAPQVAGEPHRVWAGKRPMHVEIVVDDTNKTTVYQRGFVGSLHDHVNAIGSGFPTPRNPHGLALSDIPGAGEEPTATANQDASFDDGIVDKNAPQNSPARLGDAAQPFIEQTVLSPFPGIDPVATAAGITTSAKDAWVRILDFDKDSRLKVAYSLGFQLLKLYPNLRDTNLASDPSVTPDPDSGDGWVGFSNTEDTVGTYRIYGVKATLSDGTDALLLNKELMPGWPAVIPALAAGRLLLAQVYWDGLDLFRSALKEPTSDTPAEISADIDQRSLGLVGPQQISTKGKMDPDAGILSQQVFENQVGNSAYALGTTNVTEVDFGGGNVIAGGAAITAGSDPSLASQGPAAVTGRRWTLSAGSPGSLANSYIFQLLKNLKPGRLYGLSFWYKANAAFNARLRVGLADDKIAAFNSLITLDGSVAVSPLDMTVRNDGVWHRASIILQTLSDATAVNPDPVNLKYLVFQLQQGGVSTTAGLLSLTNLQLTEGEWVPGYMGCQYVPSGGSILWDYDLVCPAGFQEVPGSYQKMLVFSDAAGAVIPIGSAGGPNFDPAAPALGNTGGESVQHHHTIDNDPLQVKAGSGGDPYAQNGANDFDTGNESVGHTHPIPGSQMPYYAMKLCRAI